MNEQRKGFSHVLITRPAAEARRLSSRLHSMGIESIVQPAQEFESRPLTGEEQSKLAGVTPPVLLIFTSPRSVEFGMAQLPKVLVQSSTVAAIGPATARALKARGRMVDVRPESGFTSEALLEQLGKSSQGGGTALIVGAPGGREILEERLSASGWDARPVWVYERRAADISDEAVRAVQQADRLLTVFTSADAMNALSQRLPPSAWYAICRGEWMVISERLQRLARAFGPSGVHLASGPQNADLAAAIRSIY